MSIYKKKQRSKIKGQRFKNVAETDIKKKLYDKARVILTALRFKSRLSNDKKIELLLRLFRQEPEMNPLQDVDTYGLEQMINYISKDGKEATAAKRLYQSMMDSYIRSLNEEKKREQLEEEEMKVTEKQIIEMVQEAIEKKKASTLLSEAPTFVKKELIPGGVSEGKESLVSFMEDVESFIEETATKAEELAQRGEEMLAIANITKNERVGARNELILNVVGYLRTMKSRISASFVDLRKALG